MFTYTFFFHKKYQHRKVQSTYVTDINRSRIHFLLACLCSSSASMIWEHNPIRNRKSNKHKHSREIFNRRNQVNYMRIPKVIASQANSEHEILSKINLRRYTKPNQTKSHKDSRCLDPNLYRWSTQNNDIPRVIVVCFPTFTQQGNQLQFKDRLSPSSSSDCKITHKRFIRARLDFQNSGRFIYKGSFVWITKLN